MIDPNILLQSKPVDTWTSATQAQNLANMGTQNQLAQQQLAQTKALAPGQLQLQQGQITGQGLENTGRGQENQQRAIDLKNQADTNAAIQKNIVTDPASGKVSINHDGVVSTLVNGGNAVAGMKYQQNANALQKGVNELQESNDKLQIDHANHVASVASTILDAPPAVRANLYPIAVAGAIKNGLIKPGDLPAQYDPSIDPLLTQARNASDKQRGVDAATVTAKSKADEDARKANQEYSGMIADAYGGVKDQASLDDANKLLTHKIPAAQLNQLVTQYGPQVQTIAQSTLTAKDRAANDIAQQTRNEAAAALKNTQAYQAAELGVRRQEVGIQQQRLAVDKAGADPWGALGLNPNPMGGGTAGAGAKSAPLTGDAFLATLPPQMAATVKAVAEGRQTNLPRGGKELDQLMGAVNAYDPTYSVQRAQQRTAFTTGAQGKNIGNLNTAVVHLDQYHEVMKAMANGSFTPGNQLYNWAAQKFGAANVTNPDFVRQSLAGEAANALKGNATDPEIAGLMKTLGKDQSPAQQAGTAVEGLKILGTKLNTYDEQYHQISPGDPWSPVLPSAKAVFQRYGVSPLARTADAANGAAAPAAPPAHGIPDLGSTFNGHKVLKVTRLPDK